MQAVSVTITRFFVQPLEYIAEAAGKSFRALFKEVPVQWQPIMFLSIVIITILFLFFMTGVQVIVTAITCYYLRFLFIFIVILIAFIYLFIYYW